MFYPESFKVTTPTDREILIARDFNAPRQLVFDAFTKPELVRRWLLGPSGWTMPICEIDLRVGGAYRYVWHKEGVNDMGMGGVFREVVSPARIVTTEKFDESWYPGEALNTTVLVEERQHHQNDDHRTLRIGGSPRHRSQVGHGARNGGWLQSSGRDVVFDARLESRSDCSES